MYDNLVILGADGGARELFWFVHDVARDVEVVFVDDLTDITEVEVAGTVWPVVKDWDFTRVRHRSPRGRQWPFDQFIIGLGNPPDKKVMVEKALARGLHPAPTLIGPDVVVRPDCTIGRGGVMVGHSVINAAVTIGDYLFLAETTVGHYARLGDYATCYHGCRVSGDDDIGEGVLLGANSVVREEVSIAPWVTVGALGCVVKDITEPHAVVGGVPARPLGADPGRG